MSLQEHVTTSRRRKDAWSDENIESLKRMHAAGVPFEQIAEAIGYSVDAVKGKCERLRLRRKPASPWTDVAIADLRRLTDEGLSCSEIACELWLLHRISVSRNSVIGKQHRLGLVSKVKPSNGQRSARPRQRRSPTGTSRRELLRKAFEAEELQIDPLCDLPPDQSDCAVTLLQLTEETCRWPLGDSSKPGMTFCGAEHVPGRPYCLRHTRLAYKPASASAA